MDKLFTLLEVQRQAQETLSRAALLHVMVNETRKIISYDQAVFWQPGLVSVSLEKASGNLALDNDSLYAQSFKADLRDIISSSPSRSVLPMPEKDGSHGIVMICRNGTEGLLGGLWLQRPAAFSEADQRILEELTVTYTSQLALWSARKRTGLLPKFQNLAPLRRFALAALIVAALFPVRLSITAPAEIVPKDSDIITAPFDGILDKVHIKPGDAVKAGDVLATMENQSLQGQMDIAAQELLTVQSALSRVQRESLSTPERKTGLTELQADIESKQISYDYARSLKERSDIKAQRDGIAVFSDTASLQGKPVNTGDKIMLVANPNDYELLVRVPVDAMVPLDTGRAITFFLNVSPLSGEQAIVRSIGYQASPDPDGLMTYKIMANIDTNARSDDLRIGWKGTARIQGAWTVLSYAILRRPIAAIRSTLGV